MSRVREKTIVEIVKDESNDRPHTYIAKLSGTPKSISGHRFTALLGLNPFVDSNNLLLMDFFGIRYSPKSDMVDLGIELEPLCIEEAYGEYEYMTFESWEYNGNVFGYDDDGIAGLPDTYVPELKLLNENKVTRSRIKTYKEGWKKQLQFYAYWWNKKLADMLGPVEKLEITKYFIPKNNLQWQLDNRNMIDSQHLHRFKVELETEQIEEDMKVAQAKRDELLAYPIIKLHIHRCNYFKNGIRQALINNKVKVKYDKEDELLHSIMGPIMKEALDIKLKGEN